MRTPFSRRDPALEVPSRYRVHVLADARTDAHGLEYRHGARRVRLDWDRVRRSFAAEVGEPQGVRAVVFDLVVEDSGAECVAFRFDVDPGEAAQAVARALVQALGAERCAPALRGLAADGVATRWYPDTSSLDEANLEAVRFG
jgi:hypothetical protein